MQLNNIIIGAIIIVICIVPFILLGQGKKKRKRKILESLNNIANQHDCTIGKHEICGDFIIGIDETKKAVFFMKQLAEKTVEQYVNLLEIANCKARTTARAVEFGNGSQSVIEKLELSFIPIDKNKKEISFEFFNTDISSQLIGELQSIEEWSKLINDFIKNKK